MTVCFRLTLRSAQRNLNFVTFLDEVVARADSLYRWIVDKLLENPVD